MAVVMFLRITKRASGSSDTDACASSLGVAWALTQQERIARSLWMGQRPIRNVHQKTMRGAREGRPETAASRAEGALDPTGGLTDPLLVLDEREANVPVAGHSKADAG
jgi:hypothetical protein